MKAPLEGEGSRVTDRLQPDFLAPADKSFFATPRWKVSVLCGDVLVAEFEWVSARDAGQAIAYLRLAYGFTSAVRYEVTRVEE